MSALTSSSSSSMLKAVKRSTFSHLYILITLIICGLTINFFQAILFYTIRPLNMRFYQHINYYLLYSLHAIILFTPQWWSNSDIRIFTDDETMKKIGKEDCILILNHTHDLDWMLGWLLADRTAILGGVKCMVKRAIASVPTFGWAWGFSDYLFLDRNWENDKSIIQKQCLYLQNYATPSWLALFPEGTRFSEEKHKASMEFAQKQGIPVLKRHLIPRTRGFVQLVQSLKGHYPAIYDATLSYDLSKSATPQLVSMLDGEQVIAEAYLRRYELIDLPDTDKEISEWLHQLFREKDALLDSYLTCGSFTDSSGFPVKPLQDSPRRPVSLISVIIWFSLSAYCIYRAALATLAQGVLGVVLAVGAFAAAYIGLQKLINITRKDKGSSYGSANCKEK
ncbi:unnamed protein product [Meganyctiphanes norvegica]|uniref:Phospholipid/glycerol acyltransferase domain-containing protein n=1 Tax=Meganyctiphanes norvegica TaxID=48144 RepID=A0AAV2PX51_MEGNR